MFYIDVNLLLQIVVIRNGCYCIKLLLLPGHVTVNTQDFTLKVTGQTLKLNGKKSSCCTSTAYDPISISISICSNHKRLNSSPEKT